MKHFTYTPGTGGNFIACLLYHSRYNKWIDGLQNNEYGCEGYIKQIKFSHYITIDPTIILHEPDKTYLFKKLTILLYKRYMAGRDLKPDTRLAINSLKHNGEYEFQLQRQIKRVVDFRHVYTWSSLFYNINRDSWIELFDFFKYDFRDEYLTHIENYSKRNEEIFNSDETIRIRQFLQKYT